MSRCWSSARATLVTGDASLRRRRHGRDPARHLGGLRREVPPLPRAGRHRAAAPQRRVLLATASSTTAGSRSAGRSTTSTCSSRGSGCSSPCPAARTRSRLWDLLLDLGLQADGLYLGLGIGEYSDESGDYTRAFAGSRGRHADRDRPARRLRFRHPDRRPGRAAGAVFGVRALETPPVQPGGCRRWLRRGRHRPQPRRRGGRSVRQRPAVVDATTSAASYPVLPASEGFVRKVKPLVRLGERETAAYCVLGASTTSSRSARWPWATSTSATRRRSTHRRAVAGLQAGVLLRVPGAGLRAVRAAGRAERDGLRSCRRAGRRRPARCARSASSSSGPSVAARERDPSGPVNGFCSSMPSSVVTS